MGTKLSVNVNKVATLRNTRAYAPGPGGQARGIPSVVRAARICLGAGAHGIAVHPRPDERHIRPHDVDDVAKLLEEFPGRELNIEGNPFAPSRLVEHARRVRPTQVTLVPDGVDQLTSDHGWDLGQVESLRDVVAELASLGARVSLFVDATATGLESAKAIGAHRVELYTEPYAAAFPHGDGAPALVAFVAAAERAAAAGLGVNAGHDLSLDNLGPFLAAVPGVLEVSIGHALVADALELGLAETVRRYLALCAA